MPRPLRIDIPGIPQHVVQRGNDRQPCFFDDADYLCYHTELREIARREGCFVHAYVLMTNHVHLLVSAGIAGAVSRMMQALGRRYVRAFNARYGRTGTLWEGRYKSCLVDTDRYLLACLRYIELNPVRAAIVAQPWDYRWSSVHGHLGLRADARLTPHAGYLALGCHANEREMAYRRVLMEALSDDVLADIRSHMQQERALGSPAFRSMVERALNRPVDVRAQGRPRRNSNANVL